MIEENDLIYRNEAIDALIAEVEENGHYRRAIKVIKNLPSAQQPERLTDKEQRIFLAAMKREEKICKQVDDECRESYEDSLVKTCHQIIRKVKSALWA